MLVRPAPIGLGAVRLLGRGACPIRVEHLDECAVRSVKLRRAPRVPAGHAQIAALDSHTAQVLVTEALQLHVLDLGKDFGPAQRWPALPIWLGFNCGLRSYRA